MLGIMVIENHFMPWPTVKCMPLIVHSSSIINSIRKAFLCHETCIITQGTCKPYVSGLVGRTCPNMTMAVERDVKIQL